MKKKLCLFLVTVALSSCSSMNSSPLITNKTNGKRTIASEPDFSSFNSTNYQRMIKLSDPDGPLKKSIRTNLNLIKEQIAIIASINVNEIEINVRLDAFNTENVDQEIKRLYAILDKLKSMARMQRIDAAIFYELEDQTQNVINALNTLKEKYDHFSVTSSSKNDINQAVLNLAKKRLGINTNIRIDAIKDNIFLYKWGHNNIKKSLEMNLDSYGSFNYLAQAFQPAQDLSKGVIPMNTFLGVDTFEFDTTTCSSKNPNRSFPLYVDNYVSKASDYVSSCSLLFRSSTQLYTSILRDIRVFANIAGSCHELDSRTMYEDVCEHLTAPKGKKIIKFFREENCKGVLTNLMSEKSNCAALGFVNESNKYDTYNLKSYMTNGVCRNVGYSQRLTKELCEEIKSEN